MRERRRYGGYIVHLGIVLMFLGFAGEGFKIDQQVLLKLGRGSHRPPLHGAQQRRQGHRRRAEADGDRAHRGHRGRQGPRHDVPGAVVLPEARAAADHRGRHPALGGRGPVPGHAGVRVERPVDEPAGRHQSPRQLDLGGVRHARASGPASRCCRSGRSRSPWAAFRPRRASPRFESAGVEDGAQADRQATPTCRGGTTAPGGAAARRRRPASGRGTCCSLRRRSPWRPASSPRGARPR